jgi:hypothetical protein
MTDLVVLALLAVVFLVFGGFIWLCEAVRS